MDEINRRFAEAQRADARRRREAMEPDPARREPVDDGADAPDLGDAALPEGSGPLTLEKRAGEWRYYLLDRRIRVGDPVELYANPAIGWVRGTFQWGRRNTSAPTVRIPATDPDDPTRILGEIELGLPAAAVCRWPRP
ncbi:MAG: hypothetical protein ABMB14_31695 [Myxococcota bacterium]